MDSINAIIFQTTKFFQIFLFITGCYFLSISIVGWYKRKEESPSLYPPKKRFALIIAAHNEEHVISHIIESLKCQNYPPRLYDIFVVADNCTDQTAKIAVSLGANVFVRSNKTQKGKGYALEWVFEKIFNLKKKYDVIGVFDADNLVSSNFLAEMNKQFSKGHKIVQGYIDSKNPFDSWITCSYSMAFWLSNRIFQLPRYYLGLSCGLCGTGFCLETEVLKKNRLGSNLSYRGSRIYYEASFK